MTNYQEIRRVVRRFVTEDREYSIKEIYDFVGNNVQLLPEDLAKTSEKKTQPRWMETVRSAVHYMNKDGEVYRTRRAHYRLTRKSTNKNRNGEDYIWTDFKSKRIVAQDHGFIVDSPRMGGKYRFSLSTSKRTIRDDRHKARLTTMIMDQRLQGVETPEITNELIAKAGRRADLPVDVPLRANIE